MINEMEKLQQIKTNLSQLQVHSPELYLKLEYIASLTRQLSIHYKYLGLLMFSEDSYVIQENRPSLIRDSVLSLYEQEVEKVKSNDSFNDFYGIIQKFQDIAYSQVFLIILGAEPSFVFQNTIIK
ncbi:hypothetical protein [Staphylococcus xylosus]|uniref:hypothetical protein n=1 Tax=Staphylococcus xylosus TaxID=1288 RepID=UPI000D1D1754|nr:hypothetical protein [Staphylococcus xylosus]MBM6638786.1 hypothetical protein [Staphylococcus xylosus]MDO5660750.1 hypothetical protein [Staphylococcus xylosus]MDW8555132.1 hypothetical protein [Staphylococcus xylosus]MEB7384348.1 hypothetical protein [Staphylococcus xylosus]MEB7831228.1 hypothetical protein [Staphylococcus xylosus]